MAGKQIIHRSVVQCHLLLRLNPRQVLGGCVSTDLTIGLVGNLCLVEDALVLTSANDLLVRAPFPGEDVVDIQSDFDCIELL